MKKNKLYIFLAILMAIFLLSFAAICNQCTAAATDEEKIDVGEEEGAAVEEETLAPEETGEEETAEEEATGEDLEAPTIELEIYEGPTYSASDDICYYRIYAIVTGNPIPDVEFSKDDSHGAWGNKKTQINLTDPSKTYTLTATATNTEGSDTDSINLDWGCNTDVAEGPSVVDIRSIETKILNLINDIRIQNGLGQLEELQPLTDIARARSTDMINRSYFSHYTPDGKNIFNILPENGISYVNGGENLGQSSPSSAGTPQAFVDAWMASPTHRDNILRSVYRYVGVGVIDEDGGVRRVVTTIFLN